VVIECGGYILVPDYNKAIVVNNAGNQTFRGVSMHHQNFIDAVRSRKRSD
jgi:hypothetical protein